MEKRSPKITYISYGYKFIEGNVGTSEEGIITLPLYMIAFFDKVSE